MPALPCLVNPRAGSADALAEALRSDGRIRVRECQPADLPDTIRDELRAGARRIVVAGGDGTIASAADVLAGSAAELAVVPGGTLNHFARSLGIPTDPRQALELAVHGSGRPVDVGYVNGRIFLNTSSVGAYLPFVRARDRWRPRVGYHLASVIAALRTLTRLPSATVEIEVGGAPRRYRSPLVFLGVGERDLRFPILGERVSDGESRLHLVSVRGKVRARHFVLLLAAAARGIEAAARTAHFDSFLVERCTLSLKRGSVAVAVDGEQLRLNTPLRYTLARGALSVVAPPADAAS